MTEQKENQQTDPKQEMTREELDRILEILYGDGGMADRQIQSSKNLLALIGIDEAGNE